jgi:serine/threonine protein kinase
MPDTNPQDTLDTKSSEARLNRFETVWLAWRAGESVPRWQEYLPADDEPCDPKLIFHLLRMDIESRVKARLPALLSEQYFEHPRLQRPDALLDGKQQVDLIHWEYQQRWNQRDAVRRIEYEAVFPRHTDALRHLKPQSHCPHCRIIIILEEEETIQTLVCPNCDRTSVTCDAPPYLMETTPSAAPPMLDLRCYELSEPLGKGGMGEVYRCCDPALGRDLAIKVIREDLPGSQDIEHRFLREARITGSLQHPGIVPIHNLGRLADGRLHYTMRLVRGQTFSDILKDERGKPERLPYLLSIFEKICQAVAYAHSKHVIHRDLKPHNIMVGRFGEVQVMDWGLAKLLTLDEATVSPQKSPEYGDTMIHTEAADTPVDLSRMGSGMGTPSYMPPEQARGEWDSVDERADVFAVGAMLCEMLTGKPAYSGTDGHEVFLRAKRGDVSEALERLEECGADTTLTTLGRECLSPQREDRPRDAAVVAKRVAAYQAEVQERLKRAEVERAESQLKAREDRKQRRLLIVLLLVLLGGAALSTWQALRATAERDDKEIALDKARSAAEAEHQAREAEAAQREKAEEQKRLADANAYKAKESAEDSKAVLEFFQERVLSAGRPEGLEGGLGKKVTLRQAVDAAEPEIAGSFSDRPLVAAAIRAALGLTYWYLGDYPKAIEQHARALELRESKLGPDDPDSLASRNNLAVAYHSAGRIADAIRLHGQNLKQYEAKLGPDHPETLRCRNNLAAAYYDAGRTAEAIPLHERTLKQKEAKLGPDHPDTLQSRNNLAVAYRAIGRLGDAIRLHEQTLKQREATLGPDHPDTMRSRNNLAVAYEEAGRIPDAIRLYEKALRQMEAKLGPDHSDTVRARNNLAVAYESAGRFRDAIGLYEETLKQMEAKHGTDHAESLVARHNLAVSYRIVGRGTDAIRLDELNLKLSENKLGAEHPDTLVSMGQLGLTYRAAGRVKDAVALLEQALERGRNLPSGLPDKLAWVRGALAETYDRAGQFPKAEAIYRELLEQARHQLGTEDVRTADQMALLAVNLLRQKKYRAAEPLLRDCLKIREARQPDAWTTYNTRSLLGTALLGQKKYAEAEPLLLRGYEGMKARADKMPPQAHALLIETLERLVQLYEAMNKPAETAKWHQQLEERKAARKKLNP